jgi:site-specific DNA-methyltransferase (adenine-specific)
MIKLILGDCLIESDKIESGSVDLILTDLPYGTVKDLGNSETIQHGMKGRTQWDSVIDTDKIMNIANRILRKNGKMILTAQQPFTNELINKALPNLPFNYSMIWEKDHFANALTAKKAPINYYEDVLVFSKNHEFEALHPLRNYALSIKLFTNYSRSRFYKELKTGGAQHFLESNKESSQFSLCTKTIYDKLIKVYKINEMQGFKEFDYLQKIDNEFKIKFSSTFNLWEGKKYKSNILKYKKDYTGHHPTQKPILLLEDLIKTFSNEIDLVVDLTMGSGSTGVACKNTNRNFTGIEKDEDYFKIAEERINKIELKMF